MICKDWNIHPREILREEFLKPFNITAYHLAKAIHVPTTRIHDIILEKRGITADTALRLARFFDTTPQFWMSLQDAYEIKQACSKYESEVDSILPIKIKTVKKEIFTDKVKRD